MGYRTRTDFWTTDLSKEMKEIIGKVDLIYSQLYVSSQRFR